MHLPTVRNKYLDTFTPHVPVARCTPRGALQPDVALFFIAGNSPMCLRHARRRDPDGHQRRRPGLRPLEVAGARQGLPALRRAQRAALGGHARSPTRTRSPRSSSSATASGSASCPTASRTPATTGTETLERLGLEPRKYVLFVGRLEPENNPHVLVEAFARISGERARGMKLVVVGGAPYAHDYIKQVQRAGDPRVIFPGYVFGRGYWELQRHAYVFCAPTEVGGTHPVILEALAAGNCVLVNDHAPNVETVGDAGLTFSGKRGRAVADRAARARSSTSPSSSSTTARRARERARRYSWDAVTDEYEQLLVSVRQMGGPGALPAELVDGAERAAEPRAARARARVTRDAARLASAARRWPASRTKPVPGTRTRVVEVVARAADGDARARAPALGRRARGTGSRTSARRPAAAGRSMPADAAAARPRRTRGARQEDRRHVGLVGRLALARRATCRPLWNVRYASAGRLVDAGRASSTSRNWLSVAHVAGSRRRCTRPR